MNMLTREAKFAGLFYPANPDETKKLIEYIEKKEINNLSHIGDAQVHVIGGIVPHAGMVYCGYQAVHFFHYIERQTFDTLVILSPSHRDGTPDLSIDSHDQWNIPGHAFDTDKELINSNLFEKATEIQIKEHAAEVMLPYVSFYQHNTKQIAVITIKKPTIENTRKVAEKLISYEKSSGKRLMVIASSDFTHQESPEASRPKDDMVLEAIKQKNDAEVMNIVKKHNISICGYGPIAALIAYTNLKSPDATMSILRRGHSGEVFPSEKVVNYVSILSAISIRKDIVKF